MKEAILVKQKDV